MWAAPSELLPGPALRLAQHEAAVVATCWLPLRGRHDVPAGAVAFGYGEQQAVLFYSLAALSVVEVAVFHQLTPWWWLDLLLAAPAVCGAIRPVGLHQSFRRCPHYLTDRVLVLRCGIFGPLQIPLTDVVAVREQFQATGSRSFAVTEDRIRLTPSGMTDVVVELADSSVAEAEGDTCAGRVSTSGVMTRPGPSSA